MNKKGKKKRVVITLPEPLHLRLKLIAVTRSCGLEDIVWPVLWTYVKKTPVKVPRLPENEE